jgi:hypothetical protein
VTLETEFEATRRIVQKVLREERTIVRSRYMVVVNSPSAGRVDLAEEEGGDAVSNAGYDADLTLVDGDPVVVLLLVDGRPFVISKVAT